MSETKTSIAWLFLLLLSGGKVYCAAGDDFTETVTLSGGKFRMGSSSADPKRGELAAKSVGVKPFVIDKYPVTNENFRKFIRAKKFKTEAEKFGWSFVFRTFVPEKVRSKIIQSVPVSSDLLYFETSASWRNFVLLRVKTSGGFLRLKFSGATRFALLSFYVDDFFFSSETSGRSTNNSRRRLSLFLYFCLFTLLVPAVDQTVDC